MVVLAQQQQFGFEEVPWYEVSDTLRRVVPEVAEIFEEWGPGKDYTLIRARYPYGAEILSQGVFHLPLPDGQVVPLSDSRVPAELRNRLSYSRMPLGILTNNTAEVFRELDDRTFSLVYFQPGLDFGIWESFGWNTPYSITSGARSVYMLPKITLSTSHKKLRREFGISLSPPKKAFEHWYTFREMSRHPDFPQRQWHTEFLFLTDKWVKQNPRHPGWQKLYNHILKIGWRQSGYGRQKSIFELDWQIMASALMNRGVRADPYITDTIKHLIYVAAGELPSMRPAINDEAGPISAIQQAYVDVYGLREYVPTIMQPGNFNIHQNDGPVYYSMQQPTLLEFEPRSRNALSTIDELREVMELVEYMYEEVAQRNLSMGDTNLQEITSNVKFDFFHSNTFAYGNIKPSLHMPIDDPRLMNMPGDVGERLFAAHSSFVKGCIRLSKRTPEE